MLSSWWLPSSDRCSCSASGILASLPVTNELVLASRPLYHHIQGHSASDTFLYSEPERRDYLKSIWRMLRIHLKVSLERSGTLVHVRSCVDYFAINWFNSTPRRSKGPTADRNGIANAIFAGRAIGYSPPIFFLVIGCSHVGLSFLPQNKN